MRQVKISREIDAELLANIKQKATIEGIGYWQWIIRALQRAIKD
jgi:predicted DNA binding CopG/RHH family protein